MDEEVFSLVDYKYIKPAEYLPTLRDNPLWYLSDTPVGQLLQECNFASDEKMEGELKGKRDETIRMFAGLLKESQIKLGDLPEYFNDDDRWDPLNWDYEHNRGKNPKVERDRTDMVVVHHTNTPSTLTYDDLNAYGLLRLYVPLTNKEPSEEAIARVAEFIRQLSPSVVLGHQDIMVNGKAMAVNCPGEKTWSLWKLRLFSLAGVVQK